MNKKPKSILPTHIKVFDFIRSFIKKNRYAPTLSEIGEATGMTKQSAFRVVNDLVALKLIKRAPRVQRGITIYRFLKK